MTTRTSIFIGLMFLLVGAAGCGQPQRQQRQPAIVGVQTTTIEDLALRLGLRIEERDDVFVVLKNAANTVLIFTRPNARFFVNGKPVGTVGEVTTEGRTVYVPELLVSQIRPHLQFAVPRPPVPLPRPSKTRALVVIDAGHGGHDPGTISPGGLYEKDIVLEVASKIARLLAQQGVGIVMTRQDDRFIELEDRAEIANRYRTDLFVSIHADSAPNRSARGFTVYLATDASPEAGQAADAIHHALAGIGSVGRGIRAADYKVLVLTSCPAVLIELGYLSNLQDAARLQDSIYQDRLAQAIADGILAVVR